MSRYELSNRTNTDQALTTFQMLECLIDERRKSNKNVNKIIFLTFQSIFFLSSFKFEYKSQSRKTISNTSNRSQRKKCCRHLLVLVELKAIFPSSSIGALVQLKSEQSQAAILGGREY